MVSYLDHKVNALYTNQNLISSKQKLKYGSPKSVVRDKLGDPIKYKEKIMLDMKRIMTVMIHFIKIISIRQYFMINITIIT